MATSTLDVTATTVESAPIANGPALAAFLGAGTGAFAMGALVLLNETNVFAAPALYGPAGGLSGRATIATVTWLIAWSVLHNRWRNRDLDPRRVYRLSVFLIAFGIVATFPPVWQLF